jgi:hypothetical protein
MTEAADVFLEYLTEANKLVTARYPSAQFYEADLSHAGLPGAQWRFVFNDPSTAPNSTVIIKRLEQGFGEPQHIDEPWLEDRVIQLPVKLGLEEARALCQTRGCGGQVTAITLRYPLYPGVKEPSYILTMSAAGRRCWVGVNSREVSCTPIEGP